MRSASRCLLLAGLAGLICSCSGGGGGSAPPPPPQVQALLFGFAPDRPVPPGFANALVNVTDSTGASVGTAQVSVNGVPLVYNGAPNHLEYEGTVPVAPGVAIALAVQAGGVTCQAAGTQITTYPALISPQSGEAWSRNSGQWVQWQAGAPLGADARYLVAALDGADPEAGVPFLQLLDTSQASCFLNGDLPPGTWDVLVGLVRQSPVAGAAANSWLMYGGFDYVPVQVYQWTRQAFSGGVIRRMVWTGSQFVAVGLLGFDGIIATSPDGLTWTHRTVPTPSRSLAGLAWSGTRLVAVGDNGTALTSPDGVAWTLQATGATLSTVVWTGTSFVAVGPFGSARTSPDGVAWTARASGTADDLSGLAWSGTRLVAVGLHGTVLTSPDGQAWTPAVSGTTANLVGVAWSGTRFVAISEQGPVLGSPDGLAWSVLGTLESSQYWGLSWTGGRFVATGSAGRVALSSDGVTWQSQAVGGPEFLYCAAGNGNLLLVGGENAVYSQ